MKNQVVPSEDFYRYMFFHHPLPMWIYDVDTLEFLEVNDAAVEKYGYFREEFRRLTLRDIRHEKDVERLQEVINARKEKGFNQSGLWTHLKKNGEELLVELSGHSIEYNSKPAALVLITDVTENTKAREKLLHSEARFKRAQTIAKMGHWELDFVTNTATWSDEAYRIYGLKPDDRKLTPESWLSLIHPEDLDYVKSEIEKNKTTLTDNAFYHRILREDGTVRHLYSTSVFEFDHSGNPSGLYGLVYDITEKKDSEYELKELNEQIKRQLEKLALSNAELERFAYVISHDLQEPLRMVGSFLQLLERKYGDQLDDAARQYIHFAVDGASRMKTLILDLLRYSRVEADADEFVEVNVAEVVQEVINIFASKIHETKAIVGVPVLPVIRANRTLLSQLFQNLVSNALKYTNAERPEINIGIEEKIDTWQFFIKDNGLGIDPKYFDKVFVIFQRLHGRDEFSGTGIGLAICKKIVEKHGGTIWIESHENKGATFYFTVKK